MPSLIKLVEEVKASSAHNKVLSLSKSMQHWGTTLASEIGIFFSYNIESFFDNYLPHANLSSARNPAMVTIPINFFEWENPAYDVDYPAATATCLGSLVVKEQGALYENASGYNNYAPCDTPLTSMYGENLPVLQRLKRIINLAGGWKF